MKDKPRLIERAFPLKQASLTSVHEKNVRHGHISTLHIWPARRPLAACRAALIATLLPAPKTPEEQQKLCERIGGTVEKKVTKKKLPDGRTIERIGEKIQGGVLHWIGSDPRSGGRKKIESYRESTDLRERKLAEFRLDIRKAYGGRAPRVLDPFAGGGAIPLEAMRLGCEVTASDINPVAWLVLKGTLDYPQQLAGKTHLLPEFILKDEEFMTSFFIQAKGCHQVDAKNAFTDLARQMEQQQYPEITFSSTEIDIQADLAWHVRAWGSWVLFQSRKELAEFYPTYADLEPKSKKNPKQYKKEPMRMVPVGKDGCADIDVLNAEFSQDYLDDGSNPRWVSKQTIAYLWARTVDCKNCGAVLPLLKTQWLCKNEHKRILLLMKENGDKTGVLFSIEHDVPEHKGSAYQKREHDKLLGAGTLTRSGARCPCCAATMTMGDIRREAQSGRLSQIPTAVVIESQATKSYRLPTAHEIECAQKAEFSLEGVFSKIPFQMPTEPTPAGGGCGASRAFSIQNYGLMQWRDLFTARQLLAHGTILRQIRCCVAGEDNPLPNEFRDAITAYLALLFDKNLAYSSSVCRWLNSLEAICNTFARFAIPITWDFAETAVINDVGGSYLSQMAWLTRYIDLELKGLSLSTPVDVVQCSATQNNEKKYDVIMTDPPYYDAIPYSDCMDFFYVWVKRIIFGTPLDKEVDFSQSTSPKWSHKDNDGELIDDASRHDGDATVSKKIYEDGMARAFMACEKSLDEHGRLVVVFAHKQPDAWETLVSAIIKAGFIVDGSWPIQTERGARMRAVSSAALTSSVWLVCKKRAKNAHPGWDSKVLEEMRANITSSLRVYWDAGIRGPDFVWAATGPAMEAYSRYPAVKKANTPGELLTISEFLASVRRMVVDFVVGRMLSGGDGGSDSTTNRIDNPTSYYLLHRHDFGLVNAPSGACILYATACGLSDMHLENTLNLVSRAGSDGSEQNDEDRASPDDAEISAGGTSGSNYKLKTWKQRKNPKMGYEAPHNYQIPLIDRVHRLMHLWKDGSGANVDDYLDGNALRNNELFDRFVQSLIELSAEGSEERSILERLSNYVKNKDSRSSAIDQLAL